MVARNNNAECLIEGLLLKLPWKKMIMVCKRRKGFGEDNDEIENEDEQNNTLDGDEDKDD